MWYQCRQGCSHALHTGWQVRALLSGTLFPKQYQNGPFLGCSGSNLCCHHLLQLNFARELCVCHNQQFLNDLGFFHLCKYWAEYVCAQYSEQIKCILRVLDLFLACRLICCIQLRKVKGYLVLAGRDWLTRAVSVRKQLLLSGLCVDSSSGSPSVSRGGKELHMVTEWLS